ncbi:MAG: hypothetical protein U9R42_02385 [Bacteroidota bacterium]|nr:hypothetical protein [Bacteroidota bacterium]
MKKAVFIILFLISCHILIYGQSVSYKTVDVGNIGLRINSAGTIGNPNIRNNPSEGPSMEYPLNSGIEHLFEGGLWIGASIGGQIRVSTTSVDAPYGYFAGGNGFEFTSIKSIDEKSSLPSSEHFSGSAQSHQDVIVWTTDSNVVIPGTSIPISNHDYPLKAVVKLESYAWNFSFADFFVILNYEITNFSDNRWDSVYLGVWNDLVVRNINVTQDNGTSFYNKGGGGYVDSFNALYVYQVLGDDYDYTQSYAANQFLGVLWRGQYLHPNNKKLIADSGYNFNTYANFWNFRKFDGSKYGAPADDIQRYNKMKKGLIFPDPQLKQASNKTQLHTAGVIPEILPGETVYFSMAFVAAKQLVYKTDNDASRAELYEHLNWAKRTFLGEDLNENGKLDAEEDLNGNNELDRYILPEPPKSPKVKVISSNNKVDIYWDNSSVFSVDPISKKMDFEGYRLYRTKVGDDLNLNMKSNAKIIAQWDSMGNNIGYNNGFQAIELSQPKFFEGDSVEYTFHYSIEGLLNGWQYLFILTAFDEGDKKLKLDPLESSFIENSYSVFVGTTADNSEKTEIGVYPNPYRVSAAWDGVSSKTRKLYFYNLPKKCEIIIYTLSGDIVTTLFHDAEFYQGEDIRWFDNYSGSDKKIFSGGEHAWDILSENSQSITQGLYLFTVKDLNNNIIKKGKFAILK